RQAVRAAQHAAGAASHLHPLEQAQREGVATEGVASVDVAAWLPDAVDQDQDAVAAEPADVEAGVAVASRAVGRAGDGESRRRAPDGYVWHPPDRLPDVRDLAVLQIGGIEDIHGKRQVLLRLLAARAADHHRRQDADRHVGTLGRVRAL